MVQKKSGNPINGTLVAAFLILIAAFLSSVINQPVEEINSVLSGQVITTVTGYATVDNSGIIKSCYNERSGINAVSGGGNKCTPAVCPTGMKDIGIISEWNENGRWYNGYRVCVNQEVAGSIVSCKYTQTQCTLPACPIGTSLQTEISEKHLEPNAERYYDQNGVEYFKDFEIIRYGICSDVKIKSAKCSQTIKGRTCTTKAPETGLKKFTNYITDIVWTSASYSRTFNYYDLYIQQSTTTTTLPSHCSSNVWDGDEADLDCGGSCNKCSDTSSCWDNSDCSSSTCYFDSATLAKRSSAGIQPGQRLSPTTSNIQYQGVCQAAAGSCTGSDCSISACNTQSTCNSNTNCAWDEYEKAGSKCKSIAGASICNRFGVKLCNYKDFLAGDYSCLKKDQQSGYYTEACVGSGSVGFWHIPEVY